MAEDSSVRMSEGSGSGLGECLARVRLVKGPGLVGRPIDRLEWGDGRGVGHREERAWWMKCQGTQRTSGFDWEAWC